MNISGDGRFALGAFGDGTIRWYDLRDGRELLAFFPHKDGKRWVAWTPEGFFAASEGGEQLLGYHLNRGAEQTPEFVSVDRLYAAFYRPDLLLARLQGDEGKIQQARAAIGDVDQVLAAGLPPDVALAGPAQVKIEGRTFVHELMLTDRGGGIGRIEYRVDGVLQADVAARPAELDRPGADGKTRRTRPLDLPPGRHEVTALAYNADGKVASRAVTQVIEVDDPLARPPALYGLVVGIDAYRDSALRLKYSAADAGALRDTLQAQGRRALRQVRSPAAAERGCHARADRAGVRSARRGRPAQRRLRPLPLRPCRHHRRNLLLRSAGRASTRTRRRCGRGASRRAGSRTC